MSQAEAGLSGEPFLDRAHLWASTRRLLARVAAAGDRRALVDECVDIVVELLDADRGLVMVYGDDGGAHVVHARGRGRRLSAREQAEVSRTVIRQVCEKNERVVWELPQDPDAAGSVIDLGILTALAAPLTVPAVDGPPRLSGVLYVDFRDVTKHVGPLHVEFFDAAATLIATVLEQSQRLRTTEASLADARASLAGAGGWSGPSLEELLRSSSLAPLRDEVASCLHSDVPILIVGESGTGKTALARAIAEASGSEPIIRAVLGSSDDLNTITSELFGHERGAFSGAMQRRVGCVAHADGGTLVLDEVLNLPLHAQQLLLDFAQFGTYRPLGYDGATPRHAAVRIIAATNGDLDTAIRERRFRQDLYYRLAGVTLRLPPLRERRADLPTLAEDVLARVDPGRSWHLSLEVRRLLVGPHLAWPGNFRSLEWGVRRARDRALVRDPDAQEILASDVAVADLGGPGDPHRAPVGDEPLGSRLRADEHQLPDGWARLLAERAELDRFERELIEAALAAHGGVVARAARALGVARTSLLSRIGTLGLDRQGRDR